MDKNEIIASLNQRYATKIFDSSKKISDFDWNIIEDALTLTPSSFGLQPWKFIVVKNSEVRRQLTPHSFNQQQIENASHLVVFAAKKQVSKDYIESYVNLVMKLRNASEKDVEFFKNWMMEFTSNQTPEQAFSWAKEQCHIALGNILTVASLMKIDACPLGGIIPEKYDEILNLKDTGYGAAVACAFGYRASDDKYSSLKKVRFAKSDVIVNI